MGPARMQAATSWMKNYSAVLRWKQVAGISGPSTRKALVKCINKLIRSKNQKLRSLPSNDTANVLCPSYWQPCCFFSLKYFYGLLFSGNFREGALSKCLQGY